MPPSKRKVVSSSETANKRVAASKNGVPAYRDSKNEEEYGIVQREFYPPEMTNARALQYNNDEIPRPIEILNGAIADTESQREAVPVKDAVVHWFKCDLRMNDNKSLHMAAQKAQSKNVPLICMYIVSPQDFQAHITSPPRVDFILRTLQILKEDLAKLDIPLYVETYEKRKTIPEKIMDLWEQWGVSHVYANIEYEVDELRREALLTRKCLDRGIAFTVVPDTCVVAPGELSSQQGKQYAVYSPWYRAWLAYLREHPEQLDPFDAPGQNPSTAREKFSNIFDKPIPEAPENKKLNEEERKRFKHLWPAGEHEALDRLNKFLDQKIGRYKDTRNFPAANTTAVISVHHAAGTLSARTSIRSARDVNSTKKLDGGHLGIVGWISEVAWRDFYKHVLAHWPYICMNKPFKPEYTNIEWSYDEELFKAWCQGRTGYPIVDAAMRQLNHIGYMHNRCRMIVASFLAKDLLIDWRMGERYFMETLIDGDFASNNGGWGFSASTGVDPQPYFRIFNPFLQSEKFDAEGEYIRKWLPELEEVKGKAIHDPYARGAGHVAEKNGYPRHIVEHKDARERALLRYKEGLGRDTA
ncbi:MAG: hypothetical protein M1835_000791 [Candelina submexicana]|nr:MAG: hypothetical protein M1835_000791 [Candelina submexicana]